MPPQFKVLSCDTTDHPLQVPKEFNLIIVIFIVMYMSHTRDGDILESTIHTHMTISYLV